MKRLHVDERAWREIDKAVDSYERQMPDLGKRFLDALDATIERIHAHPEHGPQYLSKRLQFQRTRAFPYVVIYREEADRVAILAVRHGRQRPFRR